MYCNSSSRTALIFVKEEFVIVYEKNEEEYPEGEEQDDGESHAKKFGYSKGFLLINIVEFILAKRGKIELEEYLTIRRISGAKKYAKQILTKFMS